VVAHLEWPDIASASLDVSRKALVQPEVPHELRVGCRRSDAVASWDHRPGPGGTHRSTRPWCTDDSTTVGPSVPVPASRPRSLADRHSSRKTATRSARSRAPGPPAHLSAWSKGASQSREVDSATERESMTACDRGAVDLLEGGDQAWRITRGLLRPQDRRRAHGRCRQPCRNSGKRSGT